MKHEKDNFEWTVDGSTSEQLGVLWQCAFVNLWAHDHV